MVKINQNSIMKFKKKFKANKSLFVRINVTEIVQYNSKS